MNSKRQSLAAILFATAQVAPAQAGCFDWLFGKSPDPVTPYTAGYAPPTTVIPIGPPVPVGAPIITAPASVAPSQLPYSAAYAPNVSGQTAYGAPWNTLQSATAAQAPAYAAAMPINNASVLTGRPVVPASALQQGYSAYYGAVPAANFAYQQPVLLPPAAAAPAPQPSGVASWFGKYFGNNYQSSYYNVPTTLYRPVAQVDPTTGQTVIVQQPCTTTTQQLQRSPYASLQPVPVAQPYYGEPVCGSEPVCGGEPPRYSAPNVYPAPSTYPAPNSYPAPASYSAANAYPGATSNGWSPSDVSQATAIAPMNGSSSLPYASPIPTHSYPATINSGATGGDLAPIPQPELRSRPAWSTDAPMSSSTPLPGYNGSVGSGSVGSSSLPAVPSNSGAAGGSSNSGLMQAPPLLPPATSTGSGWSSGSSSAPSSWPQAWVQPSKPADANTQPKDAYSSIPPIPAATDYRAPAWSESKADAKPTATDSNRLNPDFSKTVNQPGGVEPRTASARIQPPSFGPVAPIPPKKRDDSGWVKLD